MLGPQVGGRMGQTSAPTPEASDAEGALNAAEHLAKRLDEACGLADRIEMALFGPLPPAESGKVPTSALGGFFPRLRDVGQTQALLADRLVEALAGICRRVEQG